LKQIDAESSLESMKKKLYVEYKRNAKRRNCYWGITQEEFYPFLSQPCYYCGAKPSNTFTSERGDNLALRYSGIDRMDNNKGYVKGNLCASCKDCNTKKSNDSYDAFFEWARKIVARDNLRKEVNQ